MDSKHLHVANSIRPEDVDRRVTRQGVYPLLPASPGVPWSTYVRIQRSQRVSSRSVSSSTEALDSDQARHTTRRILQHTRSLPTDSPVPQILTTDREYRSDSGLSDRYITITPITTGVDRSSYRGYIIEHDDYATLGSITPTSSSVGMFVRPKTKSLSSYGSHMPKDKVEGERVVSTSSHPIIGESVAMFTDMTYTMLKVLNRRMAATAQARELENTLAEQAYALAQNRQSITGYLPDPVTCHSLSSQPLYMNRLPRTTNVGIPIAVSTPVPQMGLTLHRPIPTPRVRDILDPLATEQARAKYLERQMRHMKSVQLPTSESQSLEEDSLSREIQEYCSRMNEHHQYEREMHYVMLDSMKEHKERQRQQGRKERDEVYRQMSKNLDSVREVARNTFSRASTILVEEHQMALTETDFRNIKEKMNKIDQRIEGLYQNWQAEYKEAIRSKQCETQTDTPPVTSVPVETEHQEPETSPETFLPSGSPPRPIATATLRPRMREQRMSEGQTGTQSQDDGDSEENDTLEPLFMEGLPDELGPEWRVLHPFDIPGVRCPTEDTPPNHRRLAENDTLVELIQTAEYLEDAPSWEQRRFYPPRYRDPYFRGCGRGHGRGRGRGRGWLSEDVNERDIGGGQGRFYSRGNGRNGQDRNGFPPTSRRDIRLEMPPEPEPSRFLDWSSLASLPARTSPHGVLEVQEEQSNNTRNQNQLNVSTARIDNTVQTEQVRENQNIPATPIRNDLVSNEENVTIIPPIPMQSAQSWEHCMN